MISMNFDYCLTFKADRIITSKSNTEHILIAQIFHDFPSIKICIFISGRSRGHSGYRNNNMKNGVDSQPQFDVYHRVENHTIQLGATAFLPCIIKNLGNRSVRIT